MTTTFVGSENIAPETWLEERRFRVRYRCERCGKEFSRTYKIVPKNDPACPSLACGAAAALVEKDREIERLRVMLESGQAPAHIGANNLIKATDLTAKITMEDYNLTDLRDNIREGEPVAPKLPPEQQRRADSYFGGGDAGSVPVLGESRQRTMRTKQMHRLGRMAMAGAFRDMSVAPTAVVPHAVAGQPALTVVRTEPLRRQ